MHPVETGVCCDHTSPTGECGRWGCRYAHVGLLSDRGALGGKEDGAETKHEAIRSEKNEEEPKEEDKGEEVTEVDAGDKGAASSSSPAATTSLSSSLSSFSSSPSSSCSPSSSPSSPCSCHYQSSSAATRHMDGVIGPIFQRINFQRMPRDLATGRRVCFYFHHDICKAGARCEFLHVKVDSSLIRPGSFHRPTPALNGPPFLPGPIPSSGTLPFSLRECEATPQRRYISSPPPPSSGRLHPMEDHRLHNLSPQSDGRGNGWEGGQQQAQHHHHQQYHFRQEAIYAPTDHSDPLFLLAHFHVGAPPASLPPSLLGDATAPHASSFSPSSLPAHSGPAGFEMCYVYALPSCSPFFPPSHPPFPPSYSQRAEGVEGGWRGGSGSDNTQAYRVQMPYSHYHRPQQQQHQHGGRS